MNRDGEKAMLCMVKLYYVKKVQTEHTYCMLDVILVMKRSSLSTELKDSPATE